MTRPTAVFSVLHPGNIRYFKEFMESLATQISECDVLLACDDVPDIGHLLRAHQSSLNVIVLPVKGTLVQIRQASIDWLRGLPYRYYVFADSDDIQSNDRVLAAVSCLSQYQVVAHDLLPFGAGGLSKPYWSKRLLNGQQLSRADIWQSNVFGLGNTSIRREVLLQFPALPENLLAIDWFLFYHALGNQSGVFTHQGAVHYRQHSENLAGTAQVTVERLKNICRVKMAHYSALGSTEAQEQRSALSGLLEKLEKDKKYAQEAVFQLNKQPISYFWWEETNYLYG